MDRFAAFGLGLDRGTVRLVVVQPNWAGLAETVRGELAVALDGHAIDIQHIGSTAVPGLVAKPIFDFAIGIRDDIDVVRLQATLETIGW